jgi:purine catabolism regulator
LRRSATWAQVIDDPHPWDWLDPGDLVLTNGWIIPVDPPDQVRFIERMADAGLCGLLTAEDFPNRPTLSDEMLAAADSRDFPVGLAHYQTSWAEICRLVARANQVREGQVLSAILRVHDEVRCRFIHSRSGGDLLEALGKVVGAKLHIVDATTWEPLLPDTVVPELVWRDALSEAIAERGSSVPLAVALDAGQRSVLALPIPMERPAFLIVEMTGSTPPRLALLQHVSAACALEIARVDAAFHERWKAGASLLGDALEGRLHPSAVAARLHEHGLELPYVCVAIEAPVEVLDRISRSWMLKRTPHLMLSSFGGVSMSLISADEDRLEELRTLCATAHFRAGVSEPFSEAFAVADGGRQARWALEMVPPGTAGAAMYGSDAPGFPPWMLLESRQAVDRILGPVLEYDEEHGSELVTTLETYLACDRSPKRAAEALFVHTQTVSYRIARIQELTGRSLRSTADISELWFALRALTLSRAAPPHG